MRKILLMSILVLSFTSIPVDRITINTESPFSENYIEKDVVYTTEVEKVQDSNMNSELNNNIELNDVIENPTVPRNIPNTYECDAKINFL